MGGREKYEVFSGACEAICEPIFVWKSITVDGSDTIPRLLEEYCRRVIEKDNPEVVLESYRCELSKHLQDYIAAKLTQLYEDGHVICFSPFGTNNRLEIKKGTGNEMIMIYEGRRHALFDDNNCLGGVYFEYLRDTGLSSEFEVLEFQSHTPDRVWYE